VPEILTFQRGIALFNAGRFYDAHEVLEDVWRAETDLARKRFLQGLVQIAVGLHHHSTGNITGALSLMRRGRGNLMRFSAHAEEVQVEGLLTALLEFQRALEEGSSLPPLPRVELSSRPGYTA
jgi:predicted metal-dependent hydrolase